MRMSLFLRIVDSIFIQRCNSAGKLGLTPIQKYTAAVLMLAYGVPADACDEYVKIVESTTIECTRKFCKGVIDVFEEEYLRHPSAEDLQRLLEGGEDRDFLGIIGSINYRSPIFYDIESGEARFVDFTMNVRVYNLAYYLANGIYPKWSVFVQSLQLPQGNKAQLFAKQHESCRKDVERAFGVLQARFSIIRQLRNLDV
ncbi:hypothetical protein LIER_12172 [Lithospermum erythrorhizon]|uniref:Uncharacterized protein n=1 Tax=Lithospermum erythrorhizon TaxID=34254 RepID=A0AAV3PSM9_LITER